MISFGEKQRQKEKSQNFAIKGFMQTLIHIFLPNFTEIGKAEVTKWGRGIHLKKGCYFAHSLGLLKQSRQNFFLQNHSVLIPHPSAKFCANPSSF